MNEFSLRIVQLPLNIATVSQQYFFTSANTKVFSQVKETNPTTGKIINNLKMGNFFKSII